MRYDNNKTFDENFPSASTAIVIVTVLIVVAIILSVVFGV